MRHFHPINLQHHKYISNHKAIEAVLRKTSFRKGTVNCEYRFHKSVNEHQRLVSAEDKTNKFSRQEQKNAVCKDVYIKLKCQLEELIKWQNATILKSLTKYRCDFRFKFNLHNIA